MLELIKLSGLKNFVNQLSVLQLFMSVLHNCVNNRCRVTEYKLMTKIFIT